MSERHGHAEADHGHGHIPHPHDHDHGRGRVRGLGTRLRELFHPHSHDAADSVDSALESSAEGIRAVKISLVVLAATALAQALLVAVTGSVALFADTIHNVADALTAVPLWIAFVIGRRRPTRTYTYGYGRAEDLAGIFIVTMIAISAVVAGYEGINRLIHPADVRYPWVVAAAGLIGFVGNEIVAGYRIRVGKRIGSAALVADGYHARTDGFTSLAVLIGALGVIAGFPQADPIIALLITVAILVVLRSAARDIYRRLMDAVDPELTEAALDTLRATSGVRGIESVRLRWVGHQVRAEVGIVVDQQLDLVSAHGIAHEAQHNLIHRVPKLVDATVHVSPAGDGGSGQHALLDHHPRPDVVTR